MNGAAAPVDRMTRKRALEAELEVIRSQKAEVLRAIQLIAKKQKLGGPPSRAAHLSHESKLDAEKRQHQEQKRRIWLMCGKVIQELLKNSTTKLYFGEPVRGDLYPGYYEAIKQPRDLGTIKRNMEAGNYADIYGFRDDIRLCFDNCRKYNPPGHLVRGYGDAASDQFEKKWATRQIEAEWEAESRRHLLAIDRLEAEAKSLPDKIKEVDAELQELADKAKSRAGPLPPGPGRDMTFEEKRTLSHAFSTLPGERLARVLEIIAEGPSASTLEDSDEVELDLDSLDAETLWKLQAYMDSVAAEIAAKAAKPGVGLPAIPPAAAGDGARADQGAGGSDAEGVDSKGNADSTGAADPNSKKAARGQDMTTFVSATGPGAQPQILKNTAQKKDVQLQNANAWASLSQPPEGAGTQGDGAGDAAPMEDDDTLWTEFKGREEEQRQAEEKKKALEEEEKKKKEAEETAARRAAEEAAAAERRAAEEAAAAKQKEEEERRRREAEELQQLDVRGAADAEVDMMRQAGHGAAADLEELGLAARPDEEDEEDDEAMDI